jgi:hypothetical protein
MERSSQSMALLAYILFWGIVGLNFLIDIVISAEIRKLVDRYKLRTAGITVEAKLKAQSVPLRSGKSRIRHTATVEFVMSDDHVANSTISISRKQYERLKDFSCVRVTYFPAASSSWPLVRLADELSNTRAFYQSILIVCVGLVCFVGSILALLALWHTGMTSNTCTLYGGCFWR